MREPSSHGIRGSLARMGIRGCLLALLVFALFGANHASAQAITRFTRDTGHINFVSTGGSLRTQPNATEGGNPCLVAASSSQNLSGIPLGTTIRNAYLYWGGSGTTNDSVVTFNGTTVNATRTFSRTVPFNSSNHGYFGDFADVTSIVAATRNGTYTLSNLTVNTGNPWCGNSLVAGGWSLFVIYESASERLRAINVFDGMDYFYGSALTTTPDGFRVPASNIDGRLGVFTLDGDPGNSTAIGAFSESLRYNGSALDDGLQPAGSVPAVQQFDGTINTQTILTSYGIDVDQYDISGLLTPGQTSGTIQYSAGGDVVVLMAQVVSATSDPAVDLTITKTHSGTFVSGGTGAYTITVSNAAGMEREDNTVTVTDTLPAGLTFNAASGTGWTCGALGQVVTCTHGPTLNAGASFPPITLTVNVLEAAAASVNNTATVSTTSFDLNTANNSVTDATATLDPNLSTSTKTVVDVNGGEASPGDTLRYTITLIESAGGQAVNVSLTDSIPNNTTWAGFVSVPAGAATSFSPPPAGANGDGQFTVTGITVPASSSVTVEFEVTVNAATAPMSTIDNTATVTNPNGPENNPSAPQVLVTPSLVPSSGAKFLYLRRSAGGVRSLQRVRPTTADTNESLASGGTVTWVLSPFLQQQLTVPAGNIPVRLWTSRNGGTGARNVTVTLTSSAGGLNATQTLSVTPNNSTGTPTLTSFTLNNAALRTIPAGSSITMTISQVGGVNTMVIWPNGNNGSTAGVPNNSRAELNSTAVINVDSVTTWSAAFNGGSAQSTFYPSANVFVRAQVSDPFGSFDIGNVFVSVIDSAGATIVNNQQMAEQGAPATCDSTSAASCILQYQFALPASPALGGWTIRVTANEGTENTVFDLGVGNFTVVIPQPSITVLKTSSVFSAPYAGPPKRIPQSVVQYDITVTNSGPGTVDSNTLIITDPIPTDSAMYVSTTPSNPVVFVNGSGSNASGLTFTYGTSVSYSTTGASGPWGYAPQPDANGFDPAVRAVRIIPAGVMSAAGAGNPTFTIQFRVRIN